MSEVILNPDQANQPGQPVAGSPDASGGLPSPAIEVAIDQTTPPPQTSDTLQPQHAQDAAEATRVEVRRPPDAREMMDANTIIIRSLAIQENKRKPPATNEAQQSLAYLGSILVQPKGKDLEAQLRSKGGTSGGFKDTEGLPRVLEIKKPDGSTQLVSSYDKRVSDVDTEPTTKVKGEYDLSTFTGRGEDGLLGFICEGEIDDDKRNFQFNERDFIKLYLVAQKDQIAKGLDNAQDGSSPFAKPTALTDPNVLLVLSTQIGNADTFVQQMDQLRTKDPAADVDLVEGITPEQMSAALEKTGISAKSVRTFAEQMKLRVTSDRWEGSAADKQRYADDIDKIILDLDNGLLPTALQIQKLLTIGGRPHIDAKVTGIQQNIQSLQAQLQTNRNEDDRRRIEKEKTYLESQIKNITEFQSGGSGSLYRRYLDAAVNGEVDQADRDWLQRQLSESSDPITILGQFELDDSTYLAGKAYEHLIKDMPEDPSERLAWLSEFLSQHGGDIAMMLIYTFVQFSSEVLKDAAHKA